MEQEAKCSFMSEYFGHCIDSDVFHTLSSKVEAISLAPHPRNIQELRLFLGLLHYYMANFCQA